MGLNIKGVSFIKEEFEEKLKAEWLRFVCSLPLGIIKTDDEKRLNRLLIFKEQIDKLSKIVDLRLQSQSDEATEKEKEVFKKIFEEIIALLYSIQIFCKIKFIYDEQYLNACQKITLDPIFVPTNNSHYQDACIAGLGKLNILIKNMIREVELRIEDEPSYSISNSTIIKNSNIVIIDNAPSVLSRNPKTKELSLINIQLNITNTINKDNNHPPLKTWQKIGVILAIINFLLTFC